MGPIRRWPSRGGPREAAMQLRHSSRGRRHAMRGCLGPSSNPAGPFRAPLLSEALERGRQRHPRASPGIGTAYDHRSQTTLGSHVENGGAFSSLACACDPSQLLARRPPAAQRYLPKPIGANCEMGKPSRPASAPANSEKFSAQAAAAQRPQSITAASRRSPIQSSIRCQFS